ncbi:hypothetical protein [Rhizobium sp. BR 315]|uniref:hypothetical protein n=1 Tax=Rhizobium sp. BR 315 TaxID=3040014 RepID=UPI003D34D008
MRISSFGVAVLAVLISAIPSSALTYRELSKFPIEMKAAYIAGMGEGYSWSNVAAQSRGDAAIYCPPQKLGISGSQYVKLLDDYIADKTHYRSDFSPPDSEVAFVLYLALLDAFPCQR